MSSNDLEIKNEIHEDNSTKLALSTSFTISFENEDESSLKQKKNKANNVFVRRHIRTLSLPLHNTDGKHSNSQTSITKVKKLSDKESHSSIAEENKECTFDDDLRDATKSINEHININDINEVTVGNQCDSSDSEGGTYTLDKNNEDVKTARKTIDQVFGISPIESVLENIDNKGKENCRSRMVGEWIEQSDMLLQKETSPRANKNSLPTSTVNLRHKSVVSRIPSPAFSRQNGTSVVKSIEHDNDTVICQGEVNDSIKKSVLVNSPLCTNIDTESYLKETENIVTALHNRIRDRNDIECQLTTKSAMPISNTRFNRTFSLRRDRLNKPSSSVMKNTTTAVNNNPSMKITTNGIVTLNNTKYARCSDRYKSTIKSTQHNVIITKNKTQMKIDDVKKRVNSRLNSSSSNHNNSGVRSTSSLSSQEIEFQNWKRRKSYDPLKAAAEDRKKKSMMQSSAGSASVSTATLTTKKHSTILNEPQKGMSVETSASISRSASFHGLRHKNDRFKPTKSMFSETFTLTTENGESSGCNDIHTANGSVSTSSISNHKSAIYNNKMLTSDPGTNGGSSSGGGDDIWEMPKPPSTSLQNTPPESLCSRVSLLSNTMSNSSILLSSSNTKVNLLTLLNVTQLSNEIRNEIVSFNNESKSNDIDNKFNDETIVEEQNKSDNRNIDGDDSDDRSLDNYDKVDDSDDDSEWNELSGNYQLKVILNNLKEIQNFLQKLHLHY